MISKAMTAGRKFESKIELSEFWREQAKSAADELAREANKSTKMLQFIANAVKTDDKTRKLTLIKLCESSDLITSRHQALGDNLLFVTKQPLPMVVPNTRLNSSRIIAVDQNETPHPTPAMPPSRSGPE